MQTESSVEIVTGMKNRVHMVLDPLFETIGLLAAVYDMEKTRLDMIKAFEDMGLDGEAFYDKNLKVFEKYVGEFGKIQKVQS